MSASAAGGLRYVRPVEAQDLACAAAGFLGDNSVMLAQHVRRSPQRARGREQDVVSCDLVRALRCFVLLAVLCARRPLLRRSRASPSPKTSRRSSGRAARSCHRPGEIGPFSLLTYDDVRRRAAQIAAVTAPADHAAVEAGAGQGRVPGRAAPDRRASCRATAAVDRERRAGRRSPPICRRCRDWNDGWQLGTPDLVVRMPEAYTVPADGADVFRTFVHPDSGRRAAVRARDRVPSRQRARRPSREPRRRSHAFVAAARRARSRARLRRRHGAATRAIPKGSCSAGRRGRRRTRRPTACRGGSSRAAISSCSCTCSRPGSREPVQVTVGLFFTDAGADAHAGRPAARQRDDRHPAGDARAHRSPIGTCCRSTSTSSPFSRTRTTSRGGWRRPPTLPDGTHALADRDRRLGFPLAGRLSLRRADRAAEGHDDLDALHLRQLRRQPAQSASAARARRLGTEHVGRDGRPVDAGRAARQRRFQRP